MQDAGGTPTPLNATDRYNEILQKRSAAVFQFEPFFSIALYVAFL
jgi:hypothetical protein